MKKLLLLFTLISFFVSFKAQNWCPPGAIWHYRDLNLNPDTYKDGTLELQFTNTVTINNVVCKVLSGTFYGASEYNDIQTYTVSNYVTYRTYESNNVVYIFNVSSQQFDTLFNFNAHIGDTWFYALNSSFCADLEIPRTKVIVYDTSHVTINNMSLKKIITSPPGTAVESSFIERIGGFPGFLFMQQDCSMDGATIGNFSCYSDSSFVTYKKAGVTNCNVNTVSIEENTLLNQYMKLYPNPGNGNFKLDLQQPVNITVFNTFGESIYQHNFESTGNFVIDISSAPAGLYYLKAANASGNGYLKMIKQ